MQQGSPPRQVPEMEGRGGSLRRERVSGSGSGVVPPQPSAQGASPLGACQGATLPLSQGCKGLVAPQIWLQNVDPC